MRHRVLGVLLLAGCPAKGEGDDELGSSTDATSETTSTTESTTSDTSESDTSESTTTESTGGEACTVHSDCHLSNPTSFVCTAAGTCIDAFSPECQRFEWPAGRVDDEAVLVGSILAVSKPDETLGLPVQNGVELAVESFNDAAANVGSRRLAWIACDSQGSSDLAVAAAQHLVEVGVPAIIGPTFSDEVIAVAEQATVLAGVLVMSPTATHKNISALADDDLVWRTIASDVYQAAALGDRLAAVPNEKLAGLPLGPLDFDNMAIVHANDLYGTDLATDAFARLPADISAVTELHGYDVPSDPLALQGELDTLLASVAGGANPPEIVVIVGGSEAQAIIPRYYSFTQQLDPPPPFPYFVVSHDAVPALPYAIDPGATMLGADVQGLLYDHIEGVAPITIDIDNYTAFHIRYAIEFDGQAPSMTATLGYDALLVSALAMTAIPDGMAISGANIAAQIDKLVDPKGVPINVVDDVIGFVIGQLEGGSTVDLQGVSGSLDFDLETGDVRTGLLGWETIPLNNDVTKPALEPERMYILNADPATDGVWAPLP